jgi:short-subunit dehydrogenase
MVDRTEKGKAFITGASAGIGAVYADRLARRGYDLILLARDAERLHALAGRLHDATGAEVEVVKADLSTRDGREIAVRKLREDAAITLLVNNAGMAVEGKLIEADPEKLETMIALNVTAVMRLAAAAARSFAARRHGTIINIASVLALAPEILGGVYSGTKAFVLNLTQSMQVELAASGVRVQAVLPGATRTEIWDRSGGDINQLPAERLMDAEEMVDAALAGLDAGEQITIPSLPEPADFDAFTAARHALGPNLSRKHAAARYKIAESPAR